MRVLLLNLTRLGDLLQTQPVISALAGRGFAVELVCLENFCAATSLLRDLNAVHPLPGASLRALTEKQWPQAVTSLYTWKSTIRPLKKDDLIINLTPSLASRLLTGFLGDQTEAKGFTLDGYGFSLYSNDWTVYLQAASACRGSSPLNLMDVFARVAETAPIQTFSLALPDQQAQNWAQNQQQQIPEAQGLVAFQLGASNEIRRWPTAFFATLGALLWRQKQLCPVLVGSGSEKKLAEKYKQATQCPALDLCGQTSLTQLGAILRQCRFLVTNDTGTMHLAAGLGVPVLALFLATAQPWDTGPYQEKSFCLEPDIACHPCGFSTQCQKNNICRQLITPQTVFHCILKWQYGEQINLAGETGARIWESRLQHGWINLVSHTGHEASDRVRWLRIQRQAYCHLIDNHEAPHLSSLALPQGQTGEAIRSRLEISHNLLSLLLQQLDMAISRPEKIFLEKVMKSWKRIHAYWDKDEFFGVLGYLWNCHSQQHPDLPPLKELTARYLRLVTSLQALFS